MRWLANNLGLKALSVVIALVMWVFVRVEERSEQILRISILYTNLPESLIVVSEQLPQVQVTVEGSRTMLAQLQQGVPAYSIDLGDSSAGSQQFRIEPERLQLPRGVDVVRILPSVIEVELRKTMTRRLPVKAILPSNGIAEGYQLANVEITPNQVQIDVAEGELQGVESLSTYALPIDQRKSDWNGVVQIDTDRFHVKSITTREVEVFVQIAPKLAERTIANVPIVVRGLDTRYKTRQQQVTVKVNGPENLVKRLTPEAIAAYVLVKNPLPTPSRVPVFADLPAQVVLQEISPAEVTLERR